MSKEFKVADANAYPQSESYKDKECAVKLHTNQTFSQQKLKVGDVFFIRSLNQGQDAFRGQMK